VNGAEDAGLRRDEVVPAPAGDGRDPFLSQELVADGNAVELEVVGRFSTSLRVPVGAVPCTTTPGHPESLSINLLLIKHISKICN